MECRALSQKNISAKFLSVFYLHVDPTELQLRFVVINKGHTAERQLHNMWGKTTY